LVPVQYVSTRGEAKPVDFAGALLGGLAPDGGLYLPTEIPSLPSGWQEWSYVDAIAGSLSLFGAGDVHGLVAEGASNFRHPDIAPIVEAGDRLVLELFHGPTLSFKDHALQVVARLLAREAPDRTVLVATSGDTGSAAIEACRGSLEIVVLFPEGRVSELQRKQMTTVADDGVKAVAVRGTFDDCQAMVKEAFSRDRALLAVNSINWARVAAQVGYYLHAAARISGPFDVAVPTGNFGNVYSCWLAREMGAPIESMVIATNANRYLADLVTTGRAEPAQVVPTVAPAMDIQVPSNLERLPLEPSDVFHAGWADDAAIEETIGEVFEAHGHLLDPHTAAAWRVGSRHLSERPQLVVATAHPAKFPEVVEAATGHVPEPPDSLRRVLTAPESYHTIDPTLEALEEILG
jgi:threonine synthase